MYGDVPGGLILSSQLHRVDTRGVLDSRLDCPSGASLPAAAHLAFYNERGGGTIIRSG
jgi:hypothetical protein